MALATNRLIPGKEFIEYIEHTTRKKVLSWRESTYRFGREIFFTDGTMCFIDDGAYWDWESIEFLQIPKSICRICGEESHAGFIDEYGRCANKLTTFYKNMRKVYWHRYSKSKK